MRGRNTLFVNATVMPFGEGRERQLPWVVEMELPAAADGGEGGLEI